VARRRKRWLLSREKHQPQSAAFARAAVQGTKTLFEALCDFAGDSRRGIVFGPPWEDIFRALPALTADGVVQIDVENCNGDDHDVIVQSLVNENWWPGDELDENDNEGQHKRAASLTCFLSGPEASNPAPWYKAFATILPVHGVLYLPCIFWAVLDRERAATLIGLKPEVGQSSVGESLLYAYPRMQFWNSYEGPLKTIIDIKRDLEDAPSLRRDEERLLGHVRTVLAPQMRALWLSRLVAIDPKYEGAASEALAKLKTDELEDTQDWPSLWSDAGQAFARYLYWAACREVVGEEEGVAVGWIMRGLRCQAAQFSKLIDPIETHWKCPTCQARASLTQLRLSHPHVLANARLSCESCGHIEVYTRSRYGRWSDQGEGAGNAVSCTCVGCADRRNAAHEAVTAASTLLFGTLVDRMLGAFPQGSFDPEQFSAVANSLDPETVRSYAQIRSIGHDPETAATMLFGGSGMLDDDHWASPWVLAGIRAGCFERVAIEIISSKPAARAFCEQSILARMRGDDAEVMSVESFLRDLCSRDGVVFAQAVERLNRLTDYSGGVVLPGRVVARERNDLVSVGLRANEAGLEPEHIFAKESWGRAYSKKRNLEADLARHLGRIPPWPVLKPNPKSFLQQELARVHSLLAKRHRLAGPSFRRGIEDAVEHTRRDLIALEKMDRSDPLGFSRGKRMKTPKNIEYGTDSYDAYYYGRVTFHEAWREVEKEEPSNREDRTTSSSASAPD